MKFVLRESVKFFLVWIEIGRCSLHNMANALILVNAKKKHVTRFFIFFPFLSIFPFLLLSILTFWLYPIYWHLLLFRENFADRCRSSHRRCSAKEGDLRNFAKFIGKHLCQSLFLNKIEDLRPATLLKKRFWRRCFPVNLEKFLRTPFYRTRLGDYFCRRCL